MTTAKRFTTAIATGAVLLNALAPIAFAADINLNGNGANSTSNVSVNKSAATVVNQTNNANVSNNVSSKSSTGGNDANYNTGGEVRIVTGDAKTKVDIKNAVNLNKANVSTCGACDGENFDVKIKGDGAFSDNGVEVANENEVFVSQDNNADIANNVEADAKTGGNDAGYNTGGDVVIVTGDANTTVDVDNEANANYAVVGGGHGHNDGSSVEIVENGAYSENDFGFNNKSAIVLDQYNAADIRNDIKADAKTGKNGADFNTGGEVAISTGDAKTKIAVDNLVNFNSAAVDCDCVLNELDVKVGENGAFSENDVEVATEDELFNDQANDTNLGNNVDGDSKTGRNDVEFSTGSEDGDPLVWTGDAESETKVSSNGNVNVFSNGSSVHLPGDWEVDFHFDLSDLMDTLHGWN